MTSPGRPEDDRSTPGT